MKSKIITVFILIMLLFNVIYTIPVAAADSCLTKSASHSYYIGKDDAIIINYGKGNYLYDTLTITGSEIGKELIFSVRDLETLAYDTNLSLGYEGEFSFLTRGKIFSRFVLTGLKLYDFLIYCGMDKNLPDNTPVKIVAQDGYMINLTIGHLRNKNYSCFSSIDALKADSTGLPVLLSFGSAGIPLVGPTGGENVTKSFGESEGYIESADNIGGPIRFTIGQLAAGDYNAPGNSKWISGVIVGNDVDYTLHSDKVAQKEALTVNVYDNSNSALLKNETYTLSEIEAFAKKSAVYLAKNYYGDGAFYEGTDLWKFLSKKVGLAGYEGQVVLKYSDGKTENINLAYLRNLDNKYDNYVTVKDNLTITGVKPMLSYATNGVPNVNGALMAALPIDGNYKKDYTIAPCTEISVYVGIPESTHDTAPYDTYANNIITITGNGVKEETSVTVAELEERIDLTATREYEVEGENTVCCGISLIDFLNSVGLTVDAYQVILKCGENSLSFNLDDLREARDLTLLAYSKNNKPLVPDKNSIGYIKENKNSGGPIFAVNDNYYLKNVSAIEVTVKAGQWNHFAKGYESYLNTELHIYGSEAKADTTITLADFETMSDGLVRDSFAASAGKNGYQGIIPHHLIEKAP